jgi:hypothetical protein
MSEQYNLADEPGFRKGLRVVQINNVLRKEGALPSLMDDVRKNYLISCRGEEVTVYLKAVASPYTGEHGIHFLTIPDARDRRSNIPGIKDLSPADLGSTLQFAETFAYQTFQEEGIDAVDFGFHHSRAEFTRIPKQRSATFPDNFHIHITGYSGQDMKPLPRDEVLKDSDMRGKTGEALYFLGEQLVMNEVITPLRNEKPGFNGIFEEIKDERGRIRFKMRQASFENPDFPVLLQEIDKRAKETYDSLGKCFFEYDEENKRFVEKDDQYKRFKLLPVNVRKERIAEYVKKKPFLSEVARLVLQVFGQEVRDETEVVDRELTKAVKTKGAALTFEESDLIRKKTADRFWAYKDLVYTMVWSAKKQENGKVEWIFGFDPKIFTVEGIPQSSAFTDKLIVRNTKVSYTPEQLEEVQRRERMIIERVLNKHPNYQIGPGVESKA